MTEPLGSVSHYELRGHLGSGGMGEVYLAHDRLLNRAVAIKFLLDSERSDEEGRQRLLREARAAAALDHPYICAIHEVGTDERGRTFIVMQYVEGETLATRLQRGPLGVREAIDLVSGIADALDAAHRRGVVHRDLKPQNVMITTTGAPKLLDFGIAEVQRAAGDVSNGTTTTHLESGGIAGTPGYMAPEVLQGQPADARSDLFSMGVVLYECLTGARPFRGVTPQEVWGQVLHIEPARPSRARAGVDAGVDEFCRRLLAKEPGDRFQSAAQAIGALQLLRFQPRMASSSSRRNWVLAVAAALTFAILAGTWWWQRRPTLADAPAAASMWYLRGIDSVRQGAYATGRQALEEAIRIFPDYALAHSRLAEAQAELDEERAAQASLIRVSALIPDQSRLAVDDRLRLDAIRAMVLRDFDRAIAAHTALVRRRPEDAGALVDLGRAQEGAGRLTDARQSYTRATTVDRQFAVGFLRLGAIDSDAGALEPALSALDEAKRLYDIAANVEGQVEVLIRRAGILDAVGRVDDARASARRASQLAQPAGLESQQLRAEFQLASTAVGAGAFAEAENLARAAVEKATAEGLQGIAAAGLTDLAGTLMVSGRSDEADQMLVRAVAISTERSHTRTAMRAAAQRAALKLQQGLPAEALTLVDGPLRYFAASRHRRLEAVALTIASRAHVALRDYSRAREMAQRVFAFATESRNDELRAQALNSLAGISTAGGQLPEALEHRLEAERIHRDVGDTEVLPYDLTNRAELLVRLGRGDEAEHVLAEVDVGIANGVGTFPGRTRRVALVRALRAAQDGRFADVRVHARASGGASQDDTGRFARILLVWADGHLGGRQARSAAMSDSEPSDPELRYWRVAALLSHGNVSAAAVAAEALLESIISEGNDELEWRAAGMATLAARQQRDTAQTAARAAQSESALGRLRAAWGTSVTLYDARWDLVSLREAIRHPRTAAGG